LRNICLPVYVILSKSGKTTVPFCTNCGNKIDSGAAYCAYCGAPQPRSGMAPPGPTQQYGDFVDGISDRTASILCYIPVFGVIPAIVFLASQKFRANVRVRFNAFQSVYLFVTWLIVSSAMPVLVLGIPGWGMEHVFLGALKAVLFFSWIYLLVKATQEEQVKLPILGDLAARSTTEQL
jgi:uncharacterized membrane protein